MTMMAKDFSTVSTHSALEGFETVAPQSARRSQLSGFEVSVTGNAITVSNEFVTRYQTTYFVVKVSKEAGLMALIPSTKHNVFANEFFHPLINGSERTTYQIRNPKIVHDALTDAGNLDTATTNYRFIGEQIQDSDGVAVIIDLTAPAKTSTRLSRKGGSRK